MHHLHAGQEKKLDAMCKLLKTTKQNKKKHGY